MNIKRGFILRKDIKKSFALIYTLILTIVIMISMPFIVTESKTDNNSIIYPLKEISKLECRFRDFSSLGYDCKQKLPVLNTKDYKKYAKLNGGYNDFTRIYTVLWASSYKYGWDLGNGGHMGTDIATSKGTPVYAIAKGKVIVAGTKSMLGKTISIEHNINGKRIVSNYAHLSKINVRNGDLIGVGTKIGEVGSTGNSTGNHLHFQIDLKTGTHPTYYNYKTCPHSYYNITEKGLCFDELQKITVDPLAFLETAGAIINNINIPTPKINTNTLTFKNKKNLDIFNRTVYIGYSKGDIREVQRIYKEMGVYSGDMTGNYKDLVKDVTNYQLKNGIIKYKGEIGTGWFGPKTRYQTKKDYLALSDEQRKQNFNAGSSILVANNSNSKYEIQRISRKNLLTREEIEAREVRDFLKKYNVGLSLNTVGGNIALGKSITINLNITGKKKGRPFRGNMPGAMTFIVDSSKVSVFPQKLFYFTDGKRKIKLTGLKNGNTKLYIKIGNKTIKEVDLRVYNKNIKLYPETGSILMNSKTTLGEKKTGVVLFRDKSGNKLINLEYASSYKLKGNNNLKLCIKKGDINNIKQIYNKKCEEHQFKNEINFSYKDTVGGLVIFDYKGIGNSGNIEVVENYKKKQLAKKQIKFYNPKDLQKNYVYKDEVIDLLKNGIIDGVNSGYFKKDETVSKYDSLSWIRNILIKMNNDPASYSKKSQIENNLRGVYNERLKAGKNEIMTRGELLDKAYKYLVFEENYGEIKKYKDASILQERKASLIFDKVVWKDRFGENYFRPKEKIKRGEAAFLLSNAIKQNKQIFLSVR